MYLCVFGGVLRNLRRSRNLTQEELGSHIGLSKAVISKYENGLGYPNYDILIKFANFFDVSTDYLLGVVNSKTIDVSKLTDSQVETVLKIITEFNKANES